MTIDGLQTAAAVVVIFVFVAATEILFACCRLYSKISRWGKTTGADLSVVPPGKYRRGSVTHSWTETLVQNSASFANGASSSSSLPPERISTPHDELLLANIRCQDNSVATATRIDDDRDVCAPSRERRGSTGTRPDYKLLFSADFTKSLAQDWQSGQFVCLSCKVGLTGQRFILHDERPYCKICYEELFANTCDKCRAPITCDFKDLSYKEKHWHDKCFSCSGCSSSLIDQPFAHKNDLLYCAPCYENRFAAKCTLCGNIFRAGMKKYEHKGRQWHAECFRCKVCHRLIGTNSFIPQGQDVTCVPCYEKQFGQQCTKCKGMTVTLFAAVVISMLASSVYCYPYFQQRIPNGAMVPNPCDQSTIWMGVGHQNPMGRGLRNPFGLEFQANNFTWNKTICEKDSDGDGLSNGQELGDSNCTWSVGQSPARTWNLTHPGICEPLDSIRCADKNAWLSNCTYPKFNCPAIDEPGVENYTLRFPPTSVPTNETTYICYQFMLPNDTVADIIATEPIIDNKDIVHHMVLFGCTDSAADNLSNGPYTCGMGYGTTCLSLIGLWAVGGVGQCLNSQFGFRIGPTGFQYVVLQIHWNNPMRKANLTDSSGIRIYYTTKLRPNRGEILAAGQTHLVIPPGQANVTYHGNCSSLCTKAEMNRSVYITSAALHMHLLGKSGIIRLFRNGELVKVLDEVLKFDYNMPTMTAYETPVELKPGDSIEVKCVYDSTGKTTTTNWGEGTMDEMCYAFLAYYPQIQGFTWCGQWRTINSCSTKLTATSERCDLTTFIKYTAILPGLCSVSCSDVSCVGAVNAALATGCQLYEDVRFLLQTFLPIPGSVLAYCSLAQPPPPSTACTTPGSNQVPSRSSPVKSYSGSISLLAFVVYVSGLF